MKYISTDALGSLLAKKDLSSINGHCINLLVNKIKEALELKYSMSATLEKGTRIVHKNDNYYNLGYKDNEVTLSDVYSKYIDENLMLRTQMSSTIPSLLNKYQKDGDKLYLCPGIVYRRDVKDKTHVGEPHQMDVWLLSSKKMQRNDLLELVETIIKVVENLLGKNIEWRYTETLHNYTDDGIEVEILYNGRWLEILECGLISQLLLNKNDLSEYGGLALGMGLERLVMIIKSIDDIRVLNDEREEVQVQMYDLKKYKVISKQPSTKRDLSIAVNKSITEEELTEKIMENLSHDYINLIEEINIIDITLYEDLPNLAKERLGINNTQKNVLLRIILRDLVSSITSDVANEIYTSIYNKIHEGDKGYSIINKIL